MSNEGQLRSIFHHVKNIGIVVQRVQSMRMQRQQAAEKLLGSDKVFAVVREKGVAREEERGGREDVE